MALITKKDLTNLNLTKREIDIYWHLLHHGKMTVYKLAKDLNIPRSTVYGIVNSLISSGYLNSTATSKNKSFYDAIKPDQLILQIEKENEELQEQKNILSNLAIQIQNLGQSPLEMNIKYYEGESGLEQIIWNTLNCKSGNMYGISDWDRNHYLSNKFIDLHMREAHIRGPIDHLITKEGRVKDVIPHLKNYPLVVKTLPAEKLAINGDTYIYDNVFASTIVIDEQIYGFEIYNEAVAKLQLSIFMMLWQVADELDFRNL